MMYMGGKARIAKELLKVILADAKGDEVYWEPFLGGANVMRHVPATHLRIGSDIDAELMAMWQCLSLGWEPPENVTLEEWRRRFLSRGTRFSCRSIPPRKAGSVSGRKS